MSGKQPRNEVKVSRADGQLGKYIKYIRGLFEEGEKPFDKVIIKGAGNAIPTVVQLVEKLKRRIRDLHQDNHLSHFEVEESYEGEGDEQVYNRRIVLLTVTLSRKVEDLKSNSYGY